jgi:hypothetical protein
LEVVDESGWGVISKLASSVDVDIVSSSEVVDSFSERVSEELASVEPVERPVIVLTIVVTTFVLVWLPDTSEMLMAVIVLTKVVTTSALVLLLGIPETVVVDVLLARVLDLKVAGVVSLPLPADEYKLEVVLVLMVVVVELVSAVLEVVTFVEDVELNVSCAEVEVVTFVSEDDIEIETVVVFMPVL